MSRSRIAALLSGRRPEPTPEEKRAAAQAEAEARRSARSRDLQSMTDHRGARQREAPPADDPQRSGSASLRGEIESAWSDWDGR
jgi:hypothetical protein